MNYYSFHIGDYAAHTRNLSLLEDLAYRRLLDAYYLAERPLNGCATDVAREIGMRECVAEVEYVLGKFFELTEEGWSNKRAEKEIAHFSDKKQKASEAGKASAQRRSSVRSTSAGKVATSVEKVSTDVQPTNNQEPITNTTDKSVVDVSPQAAAPTALGSRLPADWRLPDPWQEWAQAERPDIDVSLAADSFKDFWISKPGKDGRKSDWQATWRNWVRNQRQATQQSSHYNGFKTARQQLIEGGAAAIFDGATHV